MSFDKDDQLAVEFVTAAANIRASSFDIPLHSLFEAKGIAGNIVHAVATTNATIAGLIVIETIKVLQNDIKNYRWVIFSILHLLPCIAAHVIDVLLFYLFFKKKKDSAGSQTFACYPVQRHPHMFLGENYDSGNYKRHNNL